MKFHIDADEIRKAWALFFKPGQFTELRAIGCTLANNWRPGVLSGYFDNPESVIETLQRVEHASGVYIVPNEINQDLAARSYNVARIVDDRSPKTSDKDIVRRRWLLIDVDATRPAGISATVDEKAAAEGLITAIDYHLWELGFPAGIIGDSGNGCHLMIPVDLPADDGGWCERILKRLAAEFDTPAAHVDTSVHNPARIWKLPGTPACKGAHCPQLGREWRMSRILQVCHETERIA